MVTQKNKIKFRIYEFNLSDFFLEETIYLFDHHWERGIAFIETDFYLN